MKKPRNTMRINTSPGESRGVIYTGDGERSWHQPINPNAQVGSSAYGSQYVAKAHTKHAGRGQLVRSSNATKSTSPANRGAQESEAELRQMPRTRFSAAN